MAAEPRVRVINGPNLNMLGAREPSVYGTQTLDDVDALCRERGQALGLAVSCCQSNHEGELVELVQGARAVADGLIVNAGAYTHTSIALLDALRAAALPCVEVHLSNIFQREAFRHTSYISPAALGVISGFGAAGYTYALDALATHLASNRAPATVGEEDRAHGQR